MLDLSYASQWRVALACAVVCAVVCETIGVHFARWTAKQPWWARALPIMRQTCYNFGFSKEPSKEFPEGTSDAIVLDLWSAVNAHVVVHFFCGGLMIPIILAGDWAAATPFARNAFVLGTLCDVGFDLYHGCRVATATFASRDFLGRLGWEKSPAAMMVLTILHHTLSVSMVVPMNHTYIELDDYRFICFSLLFAAAVCFSLNSYKMTLDVTVRADFAVFKAITVVQLAIIFYTRIWNWFQAVYRICLHFIAEGDVAFFRGGLCCAGFMTIFNLALMNDAVGGSASTASSFTPSTRRAQVETFVKWIPKPLPTPTTRGDTQKLVRELSRSCSLGSELSLSGRKPGRFRAAARAVIAAKRLSTVDSDPSGSRKED